MMKSRHKMKFMTLMIIDFKKYDRLSYQQGNDNFAAFKHL